MRPFLTTRLTSAATDLPTNAPASVPAAIREVLRMKILRESLFLFIVSLLFNFRFDRFKTFLAPTFAQNLFQEYHLNLSNIAFFGSPSF
ncbi:hypothetical protein ES703_108135 [subsurface metagenome]